MSKVPALAGASMGLLLGVLLGLSASPVAALAVGALTALLSSLVLPRLPQKGAASAAAAADRAADIRAISLGLMCLVGLFGGLWMRTHDSLSPSPRARVDALVEAGLGRDEARRAVLAAWLPASAASETSQALVHDTLLFAQAGTGRCEQLAPAHYESVAAAAEGYRAAGEAALARIATRLEGALPDEGARRKALSAVVEAVCSGG